METYILSQFNYVHFLGVYLYEKSIGYISVVLWDHFCLDHADGIEILFYYISHVNLLSCVQLLWLTSVSDPFVDYFNGSACPLIHSKGSLAVGAA